MRAATRTTGVAHQTVSDLLEHIGQPCLRIPSLRASPDLYTANQPQLGALLQCWILFVALTSISFEPDLPATTP